ncbi:hypothetical protein EMIT0P395_10532 [Pseudomonas sp. IT-P395]
MLKTNPRKLRAKESLSVLGHLVGYLQGWASAHFADLVPPFVQSQWSWLEQSQAVLRAKLLRVHWMKSLRSSRIGTSSD